MTEAGEIINLFTRKEKDDLKGLRQTPLYCPECKGRVLLKMGEKRLHILPMKGKRVVQVMERRSLLIIYKESCNYIKN